MRSFLYTRKAIVKSVRIINEYYFLAFQERCMLNALKKCLKVVESKLKDGRCNFCPGRSTTDQIFTMEQIIEKSYECSKKVFACFVDLEKVYGRVSQNKLWRVLQEYGIDGHLLMAIKSLYCKPKVCVHENGKQPRHFIWVLVFSKVVFCHLFFSQFTQMDGHA